MIEGITSGLYPGRPDYELALVQHDAYIKALSQCGVDVTVLPADENYPDSCFVEDPAVLTEKCAVITNPGAPSRNGETAAIEEAVRKFYPEDRIEHIRFPGTLEGGDVMMCGNHFFVGRSERTNEEGIRQFAEILKKYGYTCAEVRLEEVLHLKTGVNYLENNNMLVSPKMNEDPHFKDFNKFVIEPEELYAINSMNINGTVLVPEGFPKTLKIIEDLGYPTVLVNNSEFAKIDGSLTCLSLRF